MTDPRTELPINFGPNDGESGLTKREWFAGLALQGILANPKAIEDGDGNLIAISDMADWAVDQADALIAELAKGDDA